MSNNNIEIFKMTIDDLLNIKQNFMLDFDDFWSLKTFEDELKNPNSFYLVAKKENEIIAIAGMKTVLDEADIMNIVTKKKYRNMGVGTVIFEKLILTAREKNIKKLTLEVNSNNFSAIHLYEKFGFKKIALRKKYYNGIDDAIIMQLMLC